ncbi:MAG: hypothetical protein WDO74_34875 [Pseudomonadota bacterium]
MKAGRQRSRAFRAGDYVVVCSTPVGEGGRADRFLKKHPDGVGTLAFRIADAQRAFTLLDGRGATPISDVETHKDDGGTLKTFSITTPFGDTTFRFVERRGYRGFFPGFTEVPRARAGQNLCTITGVDHITSNFQTMSPALLWMEHVLGFERYWDVEFHTRDVGRVKMRDGSGLRSVVMWDRQSGLKFANNEPYRPNFKASQINLFNEDHRGDGVQHIALAVTDRDRRGSLATRSRGRVHAHTAHVLRRAARAATRAFGRRHRRGHRHLARARITGRRARFEVLPVADLPQGFGRHVWHSRSRPVFSTS